MDYGLSTINHYNMKYIPFIFIIFIIACEQVVDIEVPEHDSQLVLSSFYEAGDTKITAYLTKSAPINSNEQLDEIWDAKVNLYENDMLLGQLEDAQDTLYHDVFIEWNDSLNAPVFEEEIESIRRIYKLDLATPLQADKTYKMTAEAPGYESISATQRLVGLPEVSEVIYRPMSRPSIDGYIMDAFEVKMDDVPGEENYYEFQIYRLWDNNYDMGEWNRAWSESLTPGVEQGNWGPLLQDDLFQDGSYNVELLVWPEDTSSVDIKIEIKSISRDKYLLSKSLEAYYNADGNPFAEPVIIHTNVENGQGIFSMENKTEFILE